MNAWRRWFLMAGAAALLAGCGGLVPPIAADDLFGLDGATVDLVATEFSASALADPVTAFSGMVQVSVFSDGFDVPNIVNASKLEETIVISGAVTVLAPGDVAAELPASFSMTAGSVAITVKDGGTTLGTASGSTTFAAPLVLTKGACAWAFDVTSCGYTAVVDPDVHGVVVSSNAASAKAVFDALRAGKTLTVTGTIGSTLQAPGLTADATIRVTLATQDGSITF